MCTCSESCSMVICNDRNTRFAVLWTSDMPLSGWLYQNVQMLIEIFDCDGPVRVELPRVLSLQRTSWLPSAITKTDVMSQAPSPQSMSFCNAFSSLSVLSRTFSALCVYSKFGHHRHPLSYLCDKFCFFCCLHCWASPWRKIAYSITQSPSLFDAGNRSFCFGTGWGLAKLTTRCESGHWQAKCNWLDPCFDVFDAATECGTCKVNKHEHDTLTLCNSNATRNEVRWMG